MSVKNIVKVMNFHALLRVNEARRRVAQAYDYEKELRYIINIIVNNRIFKQEKISLQMPVGKKELNIYLASDLGFCASFNADVLGELRKDDKDNDKIIIGKKIFTNSVKNVLLSMSKEEFQENSNPVEDILIKKLLKKEYSRVNIIYIHYYNLSKQKLLKRTILPFDYFNEGIDDEQLKNIRAIDDFVVEGDLEFIIWNLIVIYLGIEMKIAEAWSYASENVQRQLFTSESLKKIEEKEEEQAIMERKIRKNEEFKLIIENNNKRERRIMEED